MGFKNDLNMTPIKDAVPEAGRPVVYLATCGGVTFLRFATPVGGQSAKDHEFGPEDGTPTHWVYWD